jgi:hypothetical protein
MKYLVVFIIALCTSQLKAANGTKQLNVGERLRINALAGESLLFEVNHADDGKDLMIQINPQKKDLDRVDADLFVWEPGQSEDDFAKCRPLFRSAQEVCLFKNAKPGKYKVRINLVNDVRSLNLITKARKKLKGKTDFQKQIDLPLFNGQSIFNSKEVVFQEITFIDYHYNSYLLFDTPRLSDIRVTINNTMLELTGNTNLDIGKIHIALPVLKPSDSLKIEFENIANYAFKMQAQFKATKDSLFLERKVLSNNTYFDVTKSNIDYVVEVPTELSGKNSTLLIGSVKSDHYNIWLRKNSLPISITDSQANTINDELGSKVGIQPVDKGIYYLNILDADGIVLELNNMYIGHVVPGTNCEKTPELCGAF